MSKIEYATMNEKTIKEAKDYRNGLCAALDITVDEMFGKCRIQPSPTKRQLISTFLDERFTKVLSMTLVGGELMRYGSRGAHSMVIYNRGQVEGGIEYNFPMMVHWHAIAKAYDDLYESKKQKTGGHWVFITNG